MIARRLTLRNHILAGYPSFPFRNIVAVVL